MADTTAEKRCQALTRAGYWAEEAERIEERLRSEQTVWTHEDGIRAIGLAQAWGTIAVALQPSDLEQLQAHVSGLEEDVEGGRAGQLELSLAIQEAVELVNGRVAALEESVEGERETRADLVGLFRGAVQLVNERVAVLEAALGRLAVVEASLGLGDHAEAD